MRQSGPKISRHSNQTAKLPVTAERPGNPLQTSADFHPEVLRAFDDYVHGLIDRRGFLDRAARLAVSGTTALGLLEALSPRFAEAQQVSPEEPRLVTGTLEVHSPDGYGSIGGYLVRPAKPAGRLPALLVVHENRGLNPHIEDVARRLALEEFVVFAPDALTPLGGYPGDEDMARESFARLDQRKSQEDFLAAARYLKRRPDSNGRVGVIGFCYGGGIAHLLATRMPELDVAVPFYGRTPAPEAASQIKAHLLVHLAEHDARINDSWPAYQAALEAARVQFDLFWYPGAQHGFCNNTTPRYDETAAKLAMKRTLDVLHRILRKPVPPAPSDNPY